MLLSVRHKFLFVHIAKTGGTSVRSVLSRHIRADPYRLAQKLCSRLSHMTGHRLGVKLPRHARIVAAQEMLPADFFEQLFSFAFVRNPWDLQVSSYHHIQRERPQVIAHLQGFEEFLRWKFEEDRPHHYILDASAEPQWLSLIDLRGRCIVDYVGRYETLTEDFEAICRRIGFKRAPVLPHRRKAHSREDYRAYYTDRAAELVAQRHREDVAAFGYTFD